MLKETWEQFIDDNYRDRPRQYSTLKAAEVVEIEDGCEIRIPVNSQAVEEWMNKKLVGQIKRQLNQPGSRYSALVPYEILYLRGDGSVAKATEEMNTLQDEGEVTTPTTKVMMPQTVQIATQANSSSYLPSSRPQKSRASEKIRRFADSIYSVESGGKRYTTPLLGWIAWPIYLVASIVSLFEKKKA